MRKKYLVNKKTKECQDRILYRNKAMSGISDAEFYSLITNVYKPPKNFDFPETRSYVRFVWFEEFHGFVILGGRMVPIAFLVFYLTIKLWEVLVPNLYRKPYQK